MKKGLVLEKELQNLAELKNDIINEVDLFNHEYSIRLGEMIQGILKIKEEILFLKMQFTGTSEASKNAFDDIKKEYEDLHDLN